MAGPPRLALLGALDLLRPHHDASFDRVTRTVAAATGCSTALITFLGPDGQWVASRVGWELEFHPLAESFCVHTLAEGDLLHVPDTSLDPRFTGNPLVWGAAGIRFYAGQPLSFNGHFLGALCVLDRRPRELTDSQRELLRNQADLISDLLQARLERAHAEAERVKGKALMAALAQSEATLRESEERYRLLWQTTTDAVLIIDGDSMVQFANPALETVFGHRPGDVLGRPLEVLQPERLRGAHARAYAAYQRTGQRRLDWRATETVGLRADGSEVPIEIAFSELEVGGRRHFAAFIRDLTERNRAQEALRNSEAKFRALTELSSDWYWEVDADFRFTFISDGARRSGLLNPEQVLGKRPWEVRAQADDANWQRLRERVMRREAFRDFEMIQPAPDGSMQVLSISGEPMFGADGAFMGYRGVGRNISHQRRAEAVQRQLEEQLRESQKLEAIGVLAGGIAHDFNNVLAGILGNAHLALDDLEPGHPAVESVQQVHKAGLRGREMVRQILTFARRRPTRPAHCELGELVEETLALLRPTVPTSVKVCALMPQMPLRVYADATQVEQALINLCANAWQAMAGAPGRIEIGAQETTLDAEQARLAGGLKPGRYVHLFVRDDGPGMDEATAARVFEPFFTTKAEGEGTGLGLSVVHGIITGHGGSITVDSAIGRGTTFNIWLPADVAAADTEPAPFQERAPQGGGKLVIYVDDDEVMTLMVTRLLERQDYRVAGFQQAEEALSFFERSPWGVDLVITDLNMPGLSGLDVLKRVRTVRPELPVIIGSGNLPQELGDTEGSMAPFTFHKQNTLEELPPLIAKVLGLKALA